MAAGGAAGVITVWNLNERRLHTILKVWRSYTIPIYLAQSSEYAVVLERRHACVVCEQVLAYGGLQLRQGMPWRAHLVCYAAWCAQHIPFLLACWFILHIQGTTSVLGVRANSAMQLTTHASCDK